MKTAKGLSVVLLVLVFVAVDVNFFVLERQFLANNEFVDLLLQRFGGPVVWSLPRLALAVQALWLLIVVDAGLRGWNRALVSGNSN